MKTVMSPGTGSVHGRPAEITSRVAIVVETDDALAREIEAALSNTARDIRRVGTGGEASALLASVQAEVVVLDTNLPDVDGLVLLSELKTANPRTPIVLVAGTRRQSDVVLGLRLGADDVVGMPFDWAELRARIDAVVGRARQLALAPATPSGPERSQIDDLVIDHINARATIAGTLLPLTPTEFRVLAALVSSPDRLVTRKELVDHIWGLGERRDSRAIDIHVGRLRKKLRAARADAPTVLPVRLQAYRLAVGDSDHDTRPSSMGMSRSPSRMAVT
jgi:DNA-binding response OmpR family regulator